MTMTTTGVPEVGVPASDLGFLLYKHPDRVHRFELSFGTAHVFYPEADNDRCTAALLVEVDVVGLVRRDRAGTGDIAHYVNDRPYAGSSLLAAALGKVFSTARSGRCDSRSDLEGLAFPLEITIPAMRSGGGAELVRRLFEPLGWDVTATAAPIDPQFPGWGNSRYVDTVLRQTITPAAALGHLYVLLPVLDGAKHYWVGPDEVDKLVRAGTGWLADHPDRELIIDRYLAHQRDYARTAAEQLETSAGDEVGPDQPTPAPLNRRRQEVVAETLVGLEVRRVVDLGCGTGALVRRLLDEPTITEIVGADVSASALERAEASLDPARTAQRRRERARWITSSVTYRDDRLAGFDAIVLMEVIEHLDPDRLPSLQTTVFGHARPRHVVITTPNAEFNPRYPGLAAGALRHRDHRFEWSRAEFTRWCAKTADRFGYSVSYAGVGDDDPELGPPTQLAVFTLADAREVDR